MADNKNPFSEDGDDERTVFTPRPAGRTPPPAAAAAATSGGPSPFAPSSPPPPASPPVGPAGVAPFTGELVLTGINRLAAAATPVLALAARLRGTARQADVEGLHARTVEAIRQFEGAARGTGLPAEVLSAGHYALCATIDDLVLATPWGGHGAWARRSMISTFHNDVTGGERFYRILHQIEQDPGRYIEALEVMYLCLSLGFEGEMRVLPRGASEHAKTRAGLYALIRKIRGPVEPELSPHWKGVTAGPNRVADAVPAWAVAVAAAAFLTVAYLAFNILLGRDADATVAGLRGLPPTAAAEITRPAPVPPPPSPPPPRESHGQRLKTFLAQEIKDGVVEVTEDAQSITVTLRASQAIGMFKSGSATVLDAYLPTISRVADGLRDEPGKVMIEGYTDSVPVHGLPFRNNLNLSKARAEAVHDLVQGKVSADRITVVPKGDADPVGDNTTAEGRERNRRIEIVLIKPPAP